MMSAQGRLIPLLSIAIFTGLTACSSSSPPMLTAGRSATSPSTRFNTSACPSSVVYVAVEESRTVLIYDKANLKNGPCGSLTGLQSPQGLFVDSKGYLWVADAAWDKVYVFAPGNDSAIKTLSDPDGVPAAVTVDENSGTAYVIEYQNNRHATTLVQVYANGSSLPTGMLGDPNARNGGFGAVDDRGNLYVSFMTQSNAAQVDEWPKGGGAPKSLGLKLVSAGAIVTTKDGSLAVCDPFAYRCGVFARGSRTMTHIFGHLGRGGSRDVVPDKRNFLHPNALAIDATERHAYVVSESLSVWKYPGPPNRPNHKAQLEVQVPFLAGYGVAAYPASPPGRPF